MIDLNLLQRYRDNEISFCEMAKNMNMCHQNLSRVFKKEGLLSNKKLKQLSVNHYFFDDINHIEKAYLLGYYIADGSIYRNGDKGSKRLSFACSVNDVELLHLIKKLLNISNVIKIETKGYKIKNTNYISKPMARLQVTSSHIFDLFTKNGYGQNKTYLNYNIPIFKNDNLFFKFLLGVFDGDGSFTISNISKTKYKNYAFCITSNCRNFLEDLKSNLGKHNIYSTIKPDKNSFTLGVYRKKSIILLRDLMYMDTELGLKRKRTKLINFENES